MNGFREATCEEMQNVNGGIALWGIALIAAAIVFAAGVITGIIKG
jgi:lactobin A/cerein 7B family class IIb bacteriocin